MADQLRETRKRTVLGDLRSVPWPTALALVAGGAVAAILLALVIDSGGGSAATPERPDSSQVGAGGKGAAAKAQPKVAREAESPSAEQASIPRMVGQQFMVGLRGANPTARLLQDARRGEIGGVLMFAENSTPAAVRAATVRLQRAARAGGNPRLLVAIDQEGGPVKRFPQGPPRRPLSSLSAAAALREGVATGRYLREYGINVNLAPVVDLGLPGSFMAEEGRTISRSPARVSRIASAFAGGLFRTRVMPVAKHFPGLGPATVNTDEGESVVDGELGSSLIPYGALVDGGIPAIMVSTAIYAKLDPSHGAAWSHKIVGGLLRGRLGFDGLVLSDDLSTAGVAESLPAAAAARAAAEAGVDVLMIGEPDSFRSAYETVLKAAEDRRISERSLSSSYLRILSAKERFGS